MIAIKLKYIIILFLWGLLLGFPAYMMAQPANCIFKDTLLNISFGSRDKLQDFNLSALKNYNRNESICPEDGQYAFTPATSNCFNGDWITLTEDHTPADSEGKMMLINSSEKPGIFFITRLSGFKENKRYEMGLWMMNVCRLNSGCPPMPPDILITLETGNGQKLAEFRTGRLTQSDHPQWSRYSGFFTSPVEPVPVFLKMNNYTRGGCGNDFALDDITFRECYPVEVEKPEVKPITAPRPAENKPVIKPVNPEPKMVHKDIMDIKPIAVKDSPTNSGQINNIRPVKIPVPKVLQTRENALIREIKASDGELLIQLYDNGTIDGDTVSIYHNNVLIVSHKELAANPLTVRVKIDPLQHHHELVMVAENLGSIPPNTSLMVITAKDKRYEIFISASEQKNAKIVIEREE